MKNKDQILLEECYRLVCEEETNQTITPVQLAEKFNKEVLSKYSFKRAGKGHLNCAWAAKTFCEWCEKTMKFPCKAIYFVWPNKQKVSELMNKGVLPPYYDPEGMSHIASIYQDTIIDFTFGQFDGNSERAYKLTPVASWKQTYGPYGYDGTNLYQDEKTEGQVGPVYIGTISDTIGWTNRNNMPMAFHAPPLNT